MAVIRNGWNPLSSDQNAANNNITLPPFLIFAFLCPGFVYNYPNIWDDGCQSLKKHYFVA